MMAQNASTCSLLNLDKFKSTPEVSTGTLIAWLSESIQSLILMSGSVFLIHAIPFHI